MKRINFSESYDALIVLNAKIPKKKFFKSFSNIPKIAADGAAISLLEIGVKADKVVGDLDSFYSSKLSQNFADTDIILDNDQESNDFEKTINYCKNSGYSKILVVGIHGGEYEHSLNNWSVFTKYSDELDLVIYDKNRYGLTISESTEINVVKNEIISLIPVGSTEISTKHLKWELNNEKLELGKREGARNESIAEKIELRIHKGKIIFFFDARLPFAPKKI